MLIEDDGTVQEKSSRALFLGESDSANESWSCHIISCHPWTRVMSWKSSLQDIRMYFTPGPEKLSGRRGKVGLRTLIDEWHACAILCPWKTGLRETSKWNRWSFRSLKPDLQWRTKAKETTEDSWSCFILLPKGWNMLECYFPSSVIGVATWHALTCFDMLWPFVAAVDFPKKSHGGHHVWNSCITAFSNIHWSLSTSQSHKSQYDSSHHALQHGASQSSDRCHCLELIALNVFS